MKNLQTLSIYLSYNGKNIYLHAMTVPMKAKALLFYITNKTNEAEAKLQIHQETASLTVMA